MHNTRLRASACLSAAAIVWASACGGAARNTSPDPPIQISIGTFLRGGSVSLANLFSHEPLVAAGWDGRPVYRLAESSASAEDGLSLTVTLRQGARFHNGDGVTAARVRDLLLRNRGLLGHVTGVDAHRDGRTLTFHLKRPHGLKLTDLSEFHIYDSANPQLRTGPFRIVALEGGAVLEGFDGYHQGTPTVGRVEIKEYPTHRAAWTAMMRDEVNFLHEVNRDAIDFIEAGGDIRAYPLLRPYYVPLMFNVKGPVFRDREVRIALNEAVDRREIVENGLRGHGEVAEGPLWPHHWAYPQGQRVQSANADAARVRLDAAGLAVRRQAADGMPSRFRFSCLLRRGDGRFERIALLLQRQFAAIEVDMQLEVLDDQDFLRRVKSGDFDTFLFEFVSGRDLSLPYQFWHSSSSMVPTGYTAADEALERMKYARTDEEVRVAVADVMRVFRTDPPAVFLVRPREARAADRSLEIPYTPDRDVFGDLWRARRAAPPD